VLLNKEADRTLSNPSLFMNQR